MNRKERKAWFRYVTDNTVASYVRWLWYASHRAEREGVIVYLAAHC